MTAQEMIDLARAQCDIDISDLTDLQMLSWINGYYGLVNATHDWPYLETTLESPVALNASTVPLPTVIPYGATRDFAWKDSSGNERGLVWINREERPTKIVAGNPSAAWIYGGLIYLDRAASPAGTFVHDYFSAPADLALTGAASVTTPVFDTRFHRMLVVGALIKAYENLDDQQAARIQKQDFDEWLFRFTRRYNRLRQSTAFGQRGRQGGRGMWPLYPFEQ